MVLTASLGSTLPQWMVQRRVEKMVYLKKWANDPKIAIADKLFFFFFSTPLYVYAYLYFTIAYFTSRQIY